MVGCVLMDLSSVFLVLERRLGLCQFLCEDGCDDVVVGWCHGGNGLGAKGLMLEVVGYLYVSAQPLRG